MVLGKREFAWGVIGKLKGVLGETRAINLRVPEGCAVSHKSRYKVLLDIDFSVSQINLDMVQSISNFVSYATQKIECKFAFII